MTELRWIDLTQQNQLIVIKSVPTFSLLFKHSTRCSVSAMAKRLFEKEWFNNSLSKQVSTYYLDLIAHRDISNAIAESFGVEHQSPQILLIKSGKCIYHASHEDIDAQAIIDFIQD